jgi:hypothetical protein
MKTKTTQTTKIGASTNTRNFFQKTFILLAVLAFTSFGFKAKAQQYVFIVTNTAPTGCDWLIVADDSMGNIYPFISYGGTSGRFGCYPNIKFYTMTYLGGGCMGYQFYPVAGVYPFTSYISTCCGSSRTIDSQSTGATSNCGSIPLSGDVNILLNIN